MSLLSLLRFPADELGRFLLAYNRKNVFDHKLSLGQAFNLFYGLRDPYLSVCKDDELALDYIREVYIRG